MHVDQKAVRPHRVRADNDRKGRAGRILIVEDELLIATDDEFILEAAGFEIVAVVGTEEDAVLFAARDRPDLVLMDVRLAGRGNGINAAIEIYRRTGIRSLFASASADPQNMLRAAAARPVGWLSKPFSSFDLVRAVERGIATAGKLTVT